MDENTTRAAIVAEAKTWIGTPYQSNAMVKGHRGGVDCAMFPIAVYAEIGCIPKEFDPRPYSPQWHVHRNEEKYVQYVSSFSKEVPGPPERAPLPADFVMFKIGQVLAHGAIVVEWPVVIHAVGNARVTVDDISKQMIGKRALWTVPKRFFSIWN